MLIKGKNRLENHVIDFLTEHGACSAKSLFQAIQSSYGPCTIQGLYRVLRQLQSQEVVVKQKKQYCLAIPWLMGISRLTDEMEETYLRHTYLSQLLPKAKSRHVWTFSNLLKMNSFWSHLLLVMAKDSNNAVALHYSPHAWYLILHRDQSMQFSKALLRQVPASLTVVGSKSYLDKMSTSVTQDIYPNKKFYLAPQDEHIEKNRSTHIDVIGDYVLEVKMDEKTTALIENLFANTVAPHDIDSSDIFPFYEHKASVKMTLKKDPKRAGIYKKKFETLFGPLHKV